jgi:hypothetical protein
LQGPPDAAEHNLRRDDEGCQLPRPKGRGLRLR